MQNLHRILLLAILQVPGRSSLHCSWLRVTGSLMRVTRHLCRSAGQLCRSPGHLCTSPRHLSWWLSNNFSMIIFRILGCVRGHDFLTPQLRHNSRHNYSTLLLWMYWRNSLKNYVRNQTSNRVGYIGNAFNSIGLQIFETEKWKCPQARCPSIFDHPLGQLMQIQFYCSQFCNYLVNCWSNKWVQFLTLLSK